MRNNISILFVDVRKINILIIFVVIISFFISCDNTQYKQIGNTTYYLFPDYNGENAFLYFKGKTKEAFFPIRHDGTISSVYWNNQFVIIKCGKSCKEPIKYWYIMKNIEEYNWKKFEIKQYLSPKDYENALDSIGLSEKRMEHTDGSIPWGIHW